MKNGKESKYQWIIAACCFLLCFTGLGFCSGNKGLFLAAVSEALGIPRSVYAVSDSLRYISTAVTNLFFGVLVQKVGVRKLVGGAMGVLALSCLVNSLAKSVLGIYLGGILLGLGLTFGGTALVGYVIKQWFRENQGTIMGVVLCANALGTAVSAPVFSRIIYSGDPFGYRNAYRMTAWILLVVGMILVLLLREAPKRDTVATKSKRGSGWSGITLQQALGKPYFYLACVCIFCTGAVLQSVTGVAVAHVKDQGLSAEFAATVSSVSALSLALFKFLTGFIYDKKGLKVTMLICDCAAVVMILLLSAVTNSPRGQVVALTYAVLAALALPLETVMLPLIAADLFGEREFAKLLGIFVSVNTAGYAVGPLLTNLCFDMVGTYRPVFLTYSVLMVGVTAGFLLVHRQVAETRREVENTVWNESLSQ